MVLAGAIISFRPRRGFRTASGKRIAMRGDKTDRSFAAMIYIATADIHSQ